MIKTKKVGIFALLLTIAIVSLSIGICACVEKGNKEGISFDKITFASHTIDVASAPDFVVEIGENKVVKVMVDNSELSKEDYLVKNGYFAFAYENFQQMGIGTHEIEVVFEQGSKRFTITVTDSKDALIKLDLQASYPIGDTVIPKAERLNKYQDYQLAYSLKKGEETIEMTECVDGFSISFTEEGSYVYTIEVTKNGSVKKNEYTINVVDEFKYSEGKNYVTEENINYFTGTSSYAWDSGRNAIKVLGYVGVSNELIHRARYAGHNYLEVVLSGDINNPSYLTFAYKATDKKQVASLGGEFYATDCLQTVIINLSNIENKDGFTEIAQGGSGLPIWIYSARFIKDSLNDNVNYASHAYKKANLWTSTDGDGTPWDYRAGDIMELWTYETILVKTSLFKEALSYGYTHVVYEAENSTTGAVLYYNQVVTGAQNKLNENTATHSSEFINGRTFVAMDISQLANSTNEYVYLAGVNKGKLLTINLTFTKDPIMGAQIRYNGAEISKKRVVVGETFDMSKFDVTLNNQVLGDVVWTLNSDIVDMTNSALELSEGIYLLKAFIKGSSGRGFAICQLSVVRPLTSEEISGELVAENKMGLWQTGGEFRYTGQYIAETQISLSAMAIKKAKEDGKNYLEITANARDGWIGIDLAPNAPIDLKASYSTYDGMSTFVVDLTNVTAEDGFIKIAWVNAYTVVVAHAEFIDKPVTEKLDYAHLGYSGDAGQLNVTVGKILSVNDIEEVKGMYDTVSQLWKAFMVAQSGTFAVKKSVVQDAIASGFTKVRLDIIGVNGATNVYYNNQLSSGALTTSATNTSTFTDKCTSITIDITNVTSIDGEWVYLAGTNSGWLVLEGMYFIK